jgi:hypothetical protein
MIPDFVDIGAPWAVLPPGIHMATLEEIRGKFAYNETRLELFNGFERACQDLVKAGCRTIYLDGSFVTEKETPGDFDGCWDPRGMEPSLLEPTLLEFGSGRRAQKSMYLGEFFPSTALAVASAGTMFLDFFQTDRFTGKPKGLIQVITTGRRSL